MEYRIPDYFEKFTCIGGACPDTCCAGWQIVIDMESLEKYQVLEGSFGNRLRNEIDWEEGVFCQYKEKCCFLNEDNLCDIYAEIGENNLCKTCRVYPRHIEEYEGLQEVFLCISCPEVSRIIFENTEKVRLLLREERQEEADEYEDFDFLFFTKLEDTREYFLELLQTREISIYNRCEYFLKTGKKLQEFIDQDELFLLDSFMEKERQKLQDYGRSGKSTDNSYRKLFMEQYFRLMLSMEIRKDDWEKQLETAKVILKKMNDTQYREQWEKFRNIHWETPEERERWEINFEKIVVYYMLTYYCGAVYDYELLCKIKFSVVHALAIEELLFVQWLQEGRKAGLTDWIRFSYEYARELEHSDLNMETLEKALMDEETYSVEKILGCF